MSKESDTSSLDQEIVRTFSIQCEKCNNYIEVPIRKADINSAIGGIFRIVVIHQCNKERVAIFLFFDKHLSLRQKVVNQIAVTDISEGDLSDRDSQIPLKQFSTLNFLYKKLGVDLAKVIFGAIVGQQIIFIGDRTEVEPSIVSMTLFVPHRKVIINSWIEEISDADFIGTTKQLMTLYPESLKVNLVTKEIINGFENQFCQQLLMNLLKITEPDKAKKAIESEIKQLQNYIHEYISVESLIEAETFYSALALDGVDQSILEIILPLSAQINPYIADYYHKESNIEKGTGAIFPSPHTFWFYDKGTNKLNITKLSGKKNIVHFRERTITKRVQRTYENKLKNETFFEFVTSSEHFLILMKDKHILTLQYPRKNEGLEAFKHALTVFNELHKFSTKDFQSTTLNQKFQPLLSSLKDNPQANNDYEIDLKLIRENIPIRNNQSVLERHYIKSRASTRDLRLVITKVIERFSTEFPLIQPKIVRSQNITSINETLTGLIANESNILDKIDINFNIIFYSHTQEINNRLDIILEFFIDSSHYIYGLETNLAFSFIYNKFVDILTKAFDECFKLKEFNGIND
ncbi:MAG: hypothetical protein JXA54_00365 [Candidatus Heimdallarchaeota archaeon]|nr:hypothetical protein [Candidatus Heimdallarchaeota archaeon]